MKLWKVMRRTSASTTYYHAVGETAEAAIARVQEAHPGKATWTACESPMGYEYAGGTVNR